VLAQYHGIASLSGAVTNIITIMITRRTSVASSMGSGGNVFGRLYHNIIIYISHHVYGMVMVVRDGHFLRRWRLRRFLRRHRDGMTIDDDVVVVIVIIISGIQHNLLHLLLLLLNLLLQLLLLLSESVVKLLLLNERG
jgi:hypothetical protein